VARPNWEYVRVDVLLPVNHKLDGLNSSAKWTLIELWAHCGQHLTDGFVRDAMWRRFGTPAGRRALVDHGLAERVDGGYQMHDYLQHQRSRAEVEDLREKRRKAGEKGGKAKANAKQVLEQVLEQNASKPLAEAEAEAEISTADLINRTNGHLPPATRIDQMIMAEILAVTGRHVSAEWAARVRGHVLGGRQPADPMAYVRQAIRAEPDPKKRFLPLY
jgi:hypothetical protein